jgi:hypothetical protein
VSVEPTGTEPPEHLRTVKLPDGRTISLDGIAWAEDDPAAVLNGEVVGRGERIAGHTVVDIERDRVVLEGDAGRLVIRLR